MGGCGDGGERRDLSLSGPSPSLYHPLSLSTKYNNFVSGLLPDVVFFGPLPLDPGTTARITQSRDGRVHSKLGERKVNLARLTAEGERSDGSQARNSSLDINWDPLKSRCTYWFLTL